MECYLAVYDFGTENEETQGAYLSAADAQRATLGEEEVTILVMVPQAEVKRLSRDLDFERSTNNFDATRLRRLATLVGASVPESDETLLASAGTVIGGICRQVEGIFKANEKLRAVLKEVSGCHEKHDTPMLCEGCLISISEALS